MSTIIRRGEQPKAVKNLGWLLRHWQEVQEIGFNYAPDGMNDGQLWAKLRDGTAYITDYASLSVCWHWLDRPVFRGLAFQFYNMKRDKAANWGASAEQVRENWLIGSSRWKEIDRMEYRQFLATVVGERQELVSVQSY